MQTPCRGGGDVDCPWDGTGTTVVTLRGAERGGRERKRGGVRREEKEKRRKEGRGEEGWRNEVRG